MHTENELDIITDIRKLACLFEWPIIANDDTTIRVKIADLATLSIASSGQDCNVSVSLSVSVKSDFLGDDSPFHPGLLALALNKMLADFKGSFTDDEI